MPSYRRPNCSDHFTYNTEILHSKSSKKCSHIITKDKIRAFTSIIDTSDPWTKNADDIITGNSKIGNTLFPYV